MVSRRRCANPKGAVNLAFWIAAYSSAGPGVEEVGDDQRAGHRKRFVPGSLARADMASGVVPDYGDRCSSGHWARPRRCDHSHAPLDVHIHATSQTVLFWRKMARVVRGIRGLCARATVLGSLPCSLSKQHHPYWHIRLLLWFARLCQFNPVPSGGRRPVNPI